MPHVQQSGKIIKERPNDWQQRVLFFFNKKCFIILWANGMNSKKERKQQQPNAPTRIIMFYEHWTKNQHSWEIKALEWLYSSDHSGWMFCWVFHLVLREANFASNEKWIFNFFFSIARKQKDIGLTRFLVINSSYSHTLINQFWSSSNFQ